MRGMWKTNVMLKNVITKTGNDHKPPANNHNPPANNHKPQANDHKLPTNDYKPPANDHKPPANDHKRSPLHIKPKRWRFVSSSRTR